jgi:hypothetical protein
MSRAGAVERRAGAVVEDVVMRWTGAWLAVGLVVVVGLGFGGAALASPLEFEADLTLRVGFGGGTASSFGVGFAEVDGEGSVAFPAIVFDLDAAFPVKVGNLTASIVVDAGNQVGALTPQGGFPAGGFGGPMPLSGDLEIPLLGARRLPMSFVGDGPSPRTFSGTSPGRDTWFIFLSGADWTTGSVHVSGSTHQGATSTTTVSGTDQRTAGGAGLVKLVTPYRITVYTEASFR